MNLIQEIFKTQKEGVEWKTLEELGKFLPGLKGKTKEDFKKGNTKFISFVNVFKNISTNLEVEDLVKLEENENQYFLEKGDVLFTGSSEIKEEVGMSSVVTKDISEKICLNSFCFIFRLNDKNIFLPDFLKYLFRMEKIRQEIIKTGQGVTRYNVSKEKFSKIKIPIPPLHIQNEIVRILDNFTELEKELEKELMVRKKQYDYYKNLMLSFIPPEGICSVYIKPFEKGIFDNDSVKWVKITDVFDLRNGYTPSKAVKEYWENGNIPWFRMEDLRQNGSILYDSVQHITIDGVKGGKLFPADSIIMATTATIGEYALIRVPSLANQQFTFFTKKGIASSGESAIQKLSSKVSSISSSPLSSSYDIDMKYFYHYCYLLGKWCKDNVSFSSFASVNMQDLKKLYIPIPSQEIQQKIVKALDMFDVLVNDLTKGLPKEIELHKKQYEYYRNLLLDFTEK